MTRYASWLSAIALISTCAGAQTVYKCVDKFGNPIFSTDPCGKDAQQVTVVPASGRDPPAPPPSAHSTPTTKKSDADTKDERECRRHAESLRIGGAQERIAELEARKASLQKQLDASRNKFVQTTYEANLRQQIVDTESAITHERIIEMPREMQADAEYRRALVECSVAARGRH